VHERLQPGPEPAGGAADALRDGAHPAVLTGEQRHDPVGLAQLLSAQHHALVPVEAHLSIVSRCRRATGVRRGPFVLGHSVLWNDITWARHSAGLPRQSRAA
jgi:hypothetical protein